jgi:hypothetical protein
VGRGGTRSDHGTHRTHRTHRSHGWAATTKSRTAAGARSRAWHGATYEYRPRAAGARWTPFIACSRRCAAMELCTGHARLRGRCRVCPYAPSWPAVSRLPGRLSRAFLAAGLAVAVVTGHLAPTPKARTSPRRDQTPTSRRAPPRRLAPFAVGRASRSRGHAALQCQSARRRCTLRPPASTGSRAPCLSALPLAMSGRRLLVLASSRADGPRRRLS